MFLTLKDLLSENSEVCDCFTAWLSHTHRLVLEFCLHTETSARGGSDEVSMSSPPLTVLSVSCRPHQNWGLHQEYGWTYPRTVAHEVWSLVSSDQGVSDRRDQVKTVSGVNDLKGLTLFLLQAADTSSYRITTVHSTPYQVLGKEQTAYCS